MLLFFVQSFLAAWKVLLFVDAVVLAVLLWLLLSVIVPQLLFDWLTSALGWLIAQCEHEPRGKFARVVSAKYRARKKKER